MRVAVAGRELHEAEPVAAGNEAHGLAVDGHHRPEVEPGRKIAPVEVVRHPARLAPRSRARSAARGPARGAWWGYIDAGARAHKRLARGRRLPRRRGEARLERAARLAGQNALPFAISNQIHR